MIFTLLTAAVHADAQTQTEQKGKASYYSRRATGARTSSGERLNNDSLVCAHRTHPFGTKLLVRNPANGKEVIVRVIDRGPFSRGRIIDLSYEAARQLGMLSAGVAMVEVSVYDDTAIPFKPKENNMVPELELEMNDGGDALNPAWHKKEKKQTKTEVAKKESTEENALHKQQQGTTDSQKEKTAKKSMEKKTSVIKKKNTTRSKTTRRKRKR